MPELPDVEIYKQHLNNILHKKIKDVKLKDNKILKTSKKKLYKIKGKNFKNIYRQGKYCFLKINKESLILHFGMTGDVKYYKGKNNPKNSVLIILFSNGYKFAFINVRKLGKIYIKNKQDFIKEKKLGPDALSINKKDFLNIIKKRKGMIKTFLMNQKLISGIGNIYADEILYHSYVKPNKKIKNIDEKKINHIYNKMKSILKIAIKKNANPNNMPKKYLINRRKINADCGFDNGKIKKIKINNRGTYYCPKHQK